MQINAHMPCIWKCQSYEADQNLWTMGKKGKRKNKRKGGRKDGRKEKKEKEGKKERGKEGKKERGWKQLVNTCSSINLEFLIPHKHVQLTDHIFWPSFSNVIIKYFKRKVSLHILYILYVTQDNSSIKKKVEVSHWSDTWRTKLFFHPWLCPISNSLSAIHKDVIDHIQYPHTFPPDGHSLPWLCALMVLSALRKITQGRGLC